MPPEDPSSRRMTWWPPWARGPSPAPAWTYTSSSPKWRRGWPASTTPWWSLISVQPPAAVAPGCPCWQPGTSWPCCRAGSRNLALILKSTPRIYCSSDQQANQIHHVGAGGPGLEQLAQLIEEVIRIVIQKVLNRINPLLQGLFTGVPIGKGPGGIGRPIGAIRAGTEKGDSRPDLQGNGCGQGQFLIPAAFSRAPDRHGGFPSGQDTGRRGDGIASHGHLFTNTHQGKRDFPGLSLNEGREDQRLVSKRPGLGGCGEKGGAIAPHHQVLNFCKHDVAGFGRVLDQTLRPFIKQVEHRLRQALGQSVTLHNF